MNAIVVCLALFTHTHDVTPVYQTCETYRLQSTPWTLARELAKILPNDEIIVTRDGTILVERTVGR